MNKKVMAIAVAGAFAVPGVALAQKSTVEIYGRANLGVDYYEAQGAVNPYNNREGRTRVFDNSSRVGFRGTEDLGGGLRAIFQLETGVNIDNGSNTGQGGQANTSSGFWASRDSFVGLDSNFGRFTLGRQSIFWANGVNAQFAANYINTELPWTNGTQLGRISTAIAGSAPARVSNTVQYTSPTFAGMNLTASWSPGSKEAVQNIGAGTQVDGAIWGLTGRGTYGPFYVQIDYANVDVPQVNTAAGVGQQGQGSSYKIGGSWGYMPGARIGAIWVKQELNNANGTVPGLAALDDVDQDGWTINWEHTFGNFQIMAQYGWTSDMKKCAPTATIACADSASTGFMIGGRYFLSKRTWLYASYNQISNDVNQFADYTGGSITSVNGAPLPLGADPKIFALGMFHAF
jgi:predicted porin